MSLLWGNVVTDNSAALALSRISVQRSSAAVHIPDEPRTRNSP